MTVRAPSEIIHAISFCVLREIAARCAAMHASSSGAVKRRWREELAAASAEESASSSDDADADATAALARWCREQRRAGRADAGATLQASQRDPRRFLSTLGASVDGRAFLLSLARRRQIAHSLFAVAIDSSI